MKYINDLIRYLTLKKRKYRNLSSILVDTFIFFLGFLISSWIVFGIFFVNDFILICIATLLIFPIIYYLSGQNKILNIYINSSTLYFFAKRNIIISVIFAILFFIFLPSPINLRFWVVFWAITTFLTTSIRLYIRDVLVKFDLSNKNEHRNNIAIYGAGQAGYQLYNSIKTSSKFNVLYFIEDDPNLIGFNIDNIPILDAKNRDSHSPFPDKLLLAIPSLNKDKKIKLINRIKSWDIPILEVPSISELASGKLKIDMLKPLQIEDLLEREVIEIDQKNLKNNFKNKTICITGAAGSIGSCLSKQLYDLEPKRLVLIDISEASLYQLHMKLNTDFSYPVEIRTLIGNAIDREFLENTFIKYEVDLVLHAAAYKHVYLSEINPIEVLKNNIFSTLSICQVAYKLNIKNIVLISTDKAVRPTNLMGVSKRICELIFQAFANKVYTSKKLKNSIFSLVRFGNVLDSSGSVVPLFKKQILSGGPITITDKNMLRYFMTIEEASTLVLESIFLAKGGEVFLLDMGSPHKIYDLAKKMIKGYGLTLKSNENKNGDIEIVFTGKREGEKIKEELLIEATSQKTSNPLIFKANESFLEEGILFNKLNDLNEYLISRNKEEAINCISELVPEWVKSELFN